MSFSFSTFWKNVAGGAFSTASNWTHGVPNSTAFADLDSLATPYTVTSATSETNGFLEVDAGATLADNGGDFTVFSSTNSFSNAYVFGVIDVNAGATMTMGQAGSPSADSTEFNGPGYVRVSSSGAEATLVDAAPWMGLFGGVHLVLSGNATIIGETTNNDILQVENASISGSGVIGNGSSATGGNGLTLANTALGTINASGPTKLVLNTGSNSIDNAGVIETTGLGGLDVDSPLQQDGRLIAAGPGALTIRNQESSGLGITSVLSGGTLALNNAGLSEQIAIGTLAAPGGLLRTTAGDTTGVPTSGAMAGDDLNTTAYNTGVIKVVNDSTLNLNASIYNFGLGFTYNPGVSTGPGSLVLGGATGPTTLELYNGGATIEGGSILLTDSSENSIVSNGVGEQFSNFSSLSGSGTIGDGWLRLYNSPDGVINSNGVHGITIVGDGNAVSAGSESTNYNAGVIKTSGTGGLIINGVLDNSGKLVAAGAGALTLNGLQINSGGGVVRTSGPGTIALENGADISKQGYVLVAAGGVLRTTSGDTGGSADTIDTTLINYGAIGVRNNSTLIVGDDHWQNSGAVTLAGSTAPTSIDIEAGADWRLSGGGSVTLNGVENSILSGGAGAELHNFDNTIKGSGTIGDSNMTILNGAGGVIDAQGAGGLFLDATRQASPSSNANLDNSGVIRSDSSLTIETELYNAGRLVADTGAKIDAEDNVYGAGVAVINGTGSIEFGGENANDVVYNPGAAGTAIFDQSATTQNFNFFGFGLGDTIDLRDFAFVSGAHVDTSTSGFGVLDGTLFLTNGSSDSSPLFLEGNYTAASLAARHLAFHVASDLHGGTNVSISTV